MKTNIYFDLKKKRFTPKITPVFNTHLVISFAHMKSSDNFVLSGYLTFMYVNGWDLPIISVEGDDKIKVSTTNCNKLFF